MNYPLVKICEYCGVEFTRRKDEQHVAFLRRKKCCATCIRDTDAKADVSVFRANPKYESDGGVNECHMFTRSWFSQNAHWRKHYH